MTSENVYGMWFQTVRELDIKARYLFYAVESGMHRDDIALMKADRDSTFERLKILSAECYKSCEMRGELEAEQEMAVYRGEAEPEGGVILDFKRPEAVILGDGEA